MNSNASSIKGNIRRICHKKMWNWLKIEQLKHMNTFCYPYWFISVSRRFVWKLLNDALIDWDYFEKVFICFTTHTHIHLRLLLIACSLNANSYSNLTVFTNLLWHLNFMDSSSLQHSFIRSFNKSYTANIWFDSQLIYFSVRLVSSWHFYFISFLLLLLFHYQNLEWVNIDPVNHNNNLISELITSQWE